MVAILLAVVLAQATLPADAAGPAPVDDAPTAFACTLDKIVRGERCTFEGAAPPAGARRIEGREQASQNAALAAGAARGCAAVASGPIRQGCEHDIAQASTAPECSLGGEAPLADASGRLLPAARGCIARLRTALDAAQRMASVSHSCCRCLSQGRCTVPELQCNRELSELSLSAALSSCVARTCSSQCSFFSSPAGDDAAPSPASGKPSPQRPASRRPAPDKI